MFHLIDNENNEMYNSIKTFLTHYIGNVLNLIPRADLKTKTYSNRNVPASAGGSVNRCHRVGKLHITQQGWRACTPPTHGHRFHHGRESERF